MLDGPTWEGQVHDCHTGSVTAVATSFDDSYLLSAAQDGTLYVHVSCYFHCSLSNTILASLGDDDFFRGPCVAAVA